MKTAVGTFRTAVLAVVSGGFLSISEIDAQTDTLSKKMLGSRKLGLLAVVSCAHALVVLNDGTFNRRSVLLGAAAAASCGQAFAPPAFAAGLPTAKVETSWMLANGVAMPTLALNTAGLSADGSERALTAALPLGFTHVDFHPGIERDGVARALATAGLTKSKDRLGKLFLTTKIAKPPAGSTPAQAAEAVRRQIDADFAVLGVDQVDMLMLRDSPDCDVMRAQWGALEEARYRFITPRHSRRRVLTLTLTPTLALALALTPNP